MPDQCSTCGITRKKREQWFYEWSSDTGEMLKRWCPDHAPPELVVKRKAARLRFQRRGP